MLGSYGVEKLAARIYQVGVRNQESRIYRVLKLRSYEVMDL